MQSRIALVSLNNSIKINHTKVLYPLDKGPTAKIQANIKYKANTWGPC